MNGGYQTLDLRNATAGDPVTIKGSYDTVKGSNGKAILIEDKDGQEVFAQAKEIDGDYVITYISAEGKTVKITITDEDAVTTVIEDDAASIEALTEGLNELNTRVDAHVITSITYDMNPTTYSEDNPFIVPADGYIRLITNGGSPTTQGITLLTLDNNGNGKEIAVANSDFGFENTVFVKKNMVVWFESNAATSGRANYYSL